MQPTPTWHRLWEPTTVRLRSGITAAQAAENLRELKRALQNPRNLRDEAVVFSRGEYPMSAKINAYLDWAQTAESQARHLFADTDIADGVFADRYWHIAALKAGSSYGTRIINQEIDHQDARLSEAIETLTQWQQLGQRPGDLLALDANIFLQCRPYDEIPWTISSARTGCG